MKISLLQIAALMLVSTNIYAANPKLQKGDLSVYPAKVELEGISPSGSPCPKGAMCIASSSPIATLKISLAGCADRVASVSYNLTAGANGKTIINVSAVAVATKQSTSARCIAAPTEYATAMLNSDSSANPADYSVNDLSGK